MFSGIIEETAPVVAIEHDKDNIHITMRCSFTDELKIDQSVAHNGVCLTVVRKEGWCAKRGTRLPQLPCVKRSNVPTWDCYNLAHS